MHKILAQRFAGEQEPGSTLLRLIACPHLAYEHGKIDRVVPEEKGDSFSASLTSSRGTV